MGGLGLFSASSFVHLHHPPNSMSILSGSYFQSQNSARWVDPGPERGLNLRRQDRGPWPGVSATPEPAVGPGLKTPQAACLPRALLAP